MACIHSKNEVRQNPEGFEKATQRNMPKMKMVQDGNKLGKISPPP
jgi:hypothetical protein